MHFFEEIGLTRLPHYTVLRDWFETISMETCRVFLGRSTEKRSGHAAIDSTGFDRDQPSRYYANRAHYRVRSLKVTALVDVKTLYVFDVHCTASKKHDAKNRAAGHSLLIVHTTASRLETIFVWIGFAH